MSKSEFLALFNSAPKIFRDLAILVGKKKLNSYDPTLRGAILQLSEKFLIILEDSSIECILHELQHYNLYKLVGVEGANFLLDGAPHDKQISLWNDLWRQFTSTKKAETIEMK